MCIWGFTFLLQIAFCLNKVPDMHSSSQDHMILDSTVSPSCTYGRNISHIKCGKVWGNCAQSFVKILLITISYTVITKGFR